MATKEASPSHKPAAASTGKSGKPGKPGKPEAKLSPKAAAAAVRIADNKKANFNYHIEERFEAGMVLEGWEVKSVREGKVQLTDGYVVIRNGEVFIIGQHAGLVTPGQKGRVIGHIGDQREHFFGAVPDEDGLVNGFHTMRSGLQLYESIAPSPFCHGHQRS